MTTRYGIGLALTLAVLPFPAHAQQIAPSANSAPSAAAMVPTTATSSVAVRNHPASTRSSLGDLSAPPRRHTDSSYTALMIVGFGALLAGAIIGGSAGTIIMIGGAFVGLYGLYMYLQ
ncbi:MAG: hypothetical protein NVS9B3_00720 [Gemmatimonadaceae bacterium]